MKDIYSGENSEYYTLKADGDAGDSPWKAQYVHEILKKNVHKPHTINEVGCGVGEILIELNNLYKDSNIIYKGYDIAIDAIKMAKKKETDNITFYNDDLTKKDVFTDVLLMIDVFEHVPDYLGFIEECAKKAKYKVYHIPLDVHVSSILRGKLIDARNEVGHLHYYTKETALATLIDTEQKIIDYFYTEGNIKTPKKTLKMRIANVFRKTLFAIAPDFTVKLIGGYSLMVLTE